jgi:hypothetical protein
VRVLLWASRKAQILKQGAREGLEKEAAEWDVQTTPPLLDSPQDENQRRNAGA